MLINSRNIKFMSGVGMLSLLFLTPLSAQNRDGYRDYRPGSTRIEPGTTLSVRTDQMIMSDRRDNRVYYGVVDRDVRGDNGRLGIPRGSRVELIVRTARDNDLIIDVESVLVNGQRYAVSTDATRVDSGGDNSLVGSIVGAINGVDTRGRRIHIPGGTVLNFRIDRPLFMGVADRGVDRDGYHYHDWYRDRYR